MQRTGFRAALAEAISGSVEVYVWGRGEYGRLGLGDTSGSSRLRAAHVPGLEGHRVVQAACGGTHTMVLTDEGRIFSWGRCSYGRLGSTADHDCYSLVEVYLPGGLPAAAPTSLPLLIPADLPAAW